MLNVNEVEGAEKTAVWRMQIRNRHIKWGVATTLFVAAGFGVPVAAIKYSQSKMAG